MRRFVISLLVLLGLPNGLAAQPLQNRIVMATSADGLAFERLNAVFADSGDVPDAVLGPDARVYAYYQGLWTPTVDGIMVGISSDGIAGWERHQIHIPGTEGWPGKPCDPDVIVTGGTFRLYFTGDPTGSFRPRTYSATALDGIHFTLEAGVRFEVAGSMVLDPSLLAAGGTLQYFAGGAPPGQNWHAHSSNGLTFVREPNFGAENLLMANGLAVPPGGYRFYAFVGNAPQNGIRSLSSSDGESWTVDPGYRLQLDPFDPLESAYVKDPAVVVKDGLHIMYFVTRKAAATEVMEVEGGPAAARGRPEAWPNPSRGVLRLGLAGREPLRIHDVRGALVRTLVLPSPAEIDLGDLPAGSYFISIGSGSDRTAARIALVK